MLIGCSMGLNSEVVYAKQYLLAYRKPLRSVAGLPNTLASLLDAIENKQCKLIDLDTLKELNLKFLNSPESGLNVGNHLGLYTNLYRIALLENEPMQSNEYLERMWILSPQPWIASIRIDNYLAQKKYSKAVNFVQIEVCQRAEKSSSQFRQVCLKGIEKIKENSN